jgi:hypothetical protein
MQYDCPFGLIQRAQKNNVEETKLGTFILYKNNLTREKISEKIISAKRKSP